MTGQSGETISYLTRSTTWRKLPSTGNILWSVLGRRLRDLIIGIKTVFIAADVRYWGTSAGAG